MEIKLGKTKRSKERSRDILSIIYSLYYETDWKMRRKGRKSNEQEAVKTRILPFLKE